MRFPGPRITVRRLKVAGAVAGLISLDGLIGAYQGVTKVQVAQVFILAIFACPFGLASMRFPLLTLGVLVAANMIEPNLYGCCNPMSIPASSCTVGWLVGAPAGWISRLFQEDAPPKGKPAPADLE